MSLSITNSSLESQPHSPISTQWDPPRFLFEFPPFDLLLPPAASRHRLRLCPSTFPRSVPASPSGRSLAPAPNLSKIKPCNLRTRSAREPVTVKPVLPSTSFQTFNCSVSSSFTKTLSSEYVAANWILRRRSSSAAFFARPPRFFCSLASRSGALASPLRRRSSAIVREPEPLRHRRRASLHSRSPSRWLRNQMTVPSRSYSTAPIRVS
mmetsp:Transcript_8084/g.20034  ORF Transcript_8084/g.20034 Transcript_8084/m.20034 type:complete len:209 (+) Transcript_8084:353-979(+)